MLLNEDTVRAVFNSFVVRQRKKLQIAACQQGRRVYSESPDAFVDSTGAYWESVWG